MPVFPLLELLLALPLVPLDPPGVAPSELLHATTEARVIVAARSKSPSFVMMNESLTCQRRLGATEATDFRTSDATSDREILAHDSELR